MSENYELSQSLLRVSLETVQEASIEKMPKICVAAPEIVMSGDITISASMSVMTKAKLDSVTIAGECACDGAPPPTPEPEPVLVTDYVIVIDGSDSYNNKVSLTLIAIY